ncbi:MAG TPA: hypothetical protein VGN33_13545, partial [Leifsonia sp.]|nr:hypothetical protein [Leifsonia sp.]
DDISVSSLRGSAALPQRPLGVVPGRRRGKAVETIELWPTVHRDVNTGVTHSGDRSNRFDKSADQPRDLPIR